MTEAMPFPKTDIVLSYESAPDDPSFCFPGKNAEFLLFFLSNPLFFVIFVI